MVLVGRPPLVVLTSIVTGGFVPVQLAQKRVMSSLGSVAVAAGGEGRATPTLAGGAPKPLVPSVVFDWSTFSALRSVTLPGLEVRSTLEGTPVWKSAWLVSKRHELACAPASEKLTTVVAPSLTATLTVVLEA